MDRWRLSSRRAGRTVRVGEREIFVAELGEGPPLVMLHGGGPGASGLANFARNTSALARALPSDRARHAGLRPLDQGPRPEGPVRRSRPLDARPARRARRRARRMCSAIRSAAPARCGWRSRRRSGSTASCCSGPAGSTRAAGRRRRGCCICSTIIRGEGPTREKCEQFLRKDLVFDGAALPDAVDRRALRGEPRSGGRRQPAARAAEGPAGPPRPRSHARSAARPRWRRRRSSSGASRIASTRRAAAARCRGGCRTATSILFSRTGHWVQWERAAEFNAAAHRPSLRRRRA